MIPGRPTREAKVVFTSDLAKTESKIHPGIIAIIAIFIAIFIAILRSSMISEISSETHPIPKVEVNYSKL